ncbi:uncharacterized protein LOC114748864 isoform X1 [Neltuma alba]|uniref:uncharacterized protein LOC114748864 isoform X1 n=2 Tax=Neltuma alba TaxID=207710 RepID=UPI0010A2D598|nr:uncharacterized protein LOC114748864 isoform X1 [Prosopis alba]
MMPHLWTPHYQSIDEIKDKLARTKHQWKSSTMEDNTKIRKYEETIKRLMQQLKIVCQERDEARRQIQVLLRKLQPCTPPHTSKKSSVSTKHCSGTSYKSFTSHCDYLSLASGGTKESDYVALSRDINMVDRLVCGKPLPQKGRLLRTVTEAGPLLHTLLLAPPPQWRNPPPFDNDNEKVDDVIPTSLSLAFHGNSRMSSPSLDVNPGIVHLNHHNFTGKKRRFL